MDFEFKVMPVDAVPDAIEQMLEPYYKTLILDDDAYRDVRDWAIADFLLVLMKGDHWVSTLELLDREIFVGDAPVRVGGISGVMTHPDFQGQGYARRVMRYALDDMRDVLHIPFGFLVCKPALVGFYGSQGWKEIDAVLHFDQPDGKSSFDPARVRGMIYPFTPQPWPGGDVDFSGPPW